MEFQLILQVIELLGIGGYMLFILAGLGLVMVIASFIAPYTETKVDDQLVTIGMRYKELFFRLLARFAMTNRKGKK